MKPIFGTAATSCCCGGSGTGGLEAASPACSRRGDRVLACPVGVFGKRLAAIARTYGIETSKSSRRARPARSTAQALRDAARAAPSVIAGILLTQNETSTGVQNDMAALARRVGEQRRHGRGRLGQRSRRIRVPHGRMGLRCRRVGVAEGARGAARPRDGRGERARAGSAIGAEPRAELLSRSAQGARFRARRPDAVDAAGLNHLALDVALELYHAAGAPRPRGQATRATRARSAPPSQRIGLERFRSPARTRSTVVAILVPDSVDGPTVARTLREERRHRRRRRPGRTQRQDLAHRHDGRPQRGDILGALSSFEAALHAHGYAAPAGEAARAAAAVLEASAEGVAAS